MAWQTPKTDWTGLDRFNAVDYNRIKNNLIYLRDVAVTMYKEFDLVTVSDDKTVRDYFYADEINKMESNLVTINENTINRPYGDSPLYNDNGNTMDYEELNRLEGATLDLYDKINNQSEGRRMFTWNFGMRGGL